MEKAKYTMIVSPRAQRDLQKLARRNVRLAKAFGACFGSLASDPRPHGVEKITGHSGTLKRHPRTGALLQQVRQVDLWRVRVEGSYRVVYAILDDLVLIVIARIGDRKEVYEAIEDIEL
ncbi:MAG: type II toxin-antitoxin system mRNA interferase toxin, RelE/StbE family [Deferrisomatales bacterium]|nr:type II toxin-antitoxin system mRNA interferase toxin, RelE/StbE family [Deferrisomatales bacterium]